EDGRRVAALSAQAGCIVAAEWHANTLTDTTVSGIAFLRAVDHPAFQTYWQPRRRMRQPECLRDLEGALPWLCALHVFHWHPESGERLPLAEGAADWHAYLERAAVGAPRWALLEFVRGDSIQQLSQDAATLRAWLS
ncbi:MAG: sugar phosphate isomerase/epimerase, partial [Phycisphaerae bacterium]|nr:sugar phosphate isomerase/epimerase [Phycisphaerae bacterium]